MPAFIRQTLLSTTALGLLASAAVAAPAVGLVGDKTLVMFDTETLAVSGTMDVTGVDRLHGIDVRPADGIPSYEYEPNRLTLVLSETGQIVDAAWD